MFGVVISGRPVQLANQVEPTKYVLNIAGASSVSHVAIFLLPNIEFDPNFTALIWFQLASAPEFKLMGGLSLTKPSAIFKINNSNNNKEVMDDIDMSDDVAPSGGDIVVGISIESNSNAEAQLAQAKQQSQIQQNKPTQQLLMSASQQATVEPKDTAILANRIVQHAYNFLGSFVDVSGKVPMKAFDSWWDKFKAKLQNNPRFLEEMEG